MLIKDKFKQWVDSRQGEFSLHEAKAFYDSVATGDPRFTYSAVYRLLGEFAQFVGYRSLPGGEASRAYKPLRSGPVLPPNLRFVYTGAAKDPKVVMTDVPDDVPALEKHQIETVVVSIIEDFERDFRAFQGADADVGFKHLKCWTAGSTLVVVHVSPGGSDDWSQREYHITVAKVQQRGELQL